MGVDHAVARGGPLLPFTRHAPLLHLPSLVHTARAAKIDVPYVTVPVAQRDVWRDRLERTSSRDALLVGLAWAEDAVPHAAVPRTPHRGSLSMFAAFAAIEDVRFVSVQRGPHAHELLAMPHDLRIESDPDATASLTGLAAVLATLDLVITVDPRVAHLAGALGVPVWTMLPRGVLWPWPTGGERTSWYATMRLFRQSATGDWSNVIAEVREALRHIEARPLRAGL